MIKSLTTAEAKEKGYEIVKGDYVGSTNNNADRWYFDNINSSTTDRRGRGYMTRKEALAALTEHLAVRGEL